MHDYVCMRRMHLCVMCADDTPRVWFIKPRASGFIGTCKDEGVKDDEDEDADEDEDEDEDEEEKALVFVDVCAAADARIAADGWTTVDVRTDMI